MNGIHEILLGKFLEGYQEFMPVLLEVDSNFTGVGSQQTEVQTETVDDDVIIMGVSFVTNSTSPGEMTAKVTDTARGYVWNNKFIPITALAGLANQVSPVLPLPVPWLLRKQSRLQVNLVNASTSPGNATSKLVFHGIRVK